MSWGTNKAYPVPWRNAWTCEQNMQMCYPHELIDWSPKLYALIIQYGEAFDDEWWYYLSRKGNIIKRVPVMRTQKKIFSEKPRRYEPNQKLTELLQAKK